MATYAVGDLQGCLQPLKCLLGRVNFNPAVDHLWLVGDLVNRGPDSLAVLRWAKNLGDAAVTVLGNHDLHLLAVAEGFVAPHRSDTLDEILAAPDRQELLDWLRRRRLLHAEGGYALVHAGLLPQWTVVQALALAQEVEAMLAGENYRDFLAHMYGNEPRQWRDNLSGMARLRTITNAMTRLRFCTPEGAMEFAHKGPLDQPPPGHLPWFDIAGRASRDATVIFGHWSALGLYQRPDVVSLDTGCLWGGTLTALCLEDRRIFQVPCAAAVGSKHRR